METKEKRNTEELIWKTADDTASAYLVHKKSSEFRGAERCSTLRRYDGLSKLLDTVKESNFDEAILAKDIMKGYLTGKYQIKDFRGLIDEGLDDDQMMLGEQRDGKAKRLYSILERAALAEKRHASLVKRAKVYAGRYEVTVTPDVLFRTAHSVELVLYRVGKPTVTQNGKKQDASVNNCLELYFLLKYARRFVPDGKAMDVKASYYFLRKKTDKATELANEDFFETKGGNIVTLTEENYIGGTTTPGELDEQFLAQLDEFTQGTDACAEDACRYCKMHSQCYWQKTPEKYEKKTLSGKQGVIVPSDEQQEVIDFRSGYCKVNAGAGTGKTECMTERGARMFAEGTDPRKMLFITFTEAGATEMKERLVKKTAARGLAITEADIMAMTFNAFDYQIIKENYEELGFETMPKVVGRVKSAAILTRLMDEKPVSGLDYLNYTMDGGALSCAQKIMEIIKTEKLDPDEQGAPYLLEAAIADTGLAKYLEHVSMQDLLELYKEYDAELKKDNLIQFADQEPLADKFLDAHPDYLEERYGFEHIIVDEFQDSNDGQLDKINRLRNCKSCKSLMVVGDDAQAIYSFRHTSPENMIHFFEKLNVTGAELFLTQNRRSRQEIIELSNALIDLNTEKVDKTMQSTRGAGGRTEVKGFFKKAVEYEWIATQIGELIDSGVQPESIAFIAYTRAEITDMSAVLSRHGIPWVMKNPLLLKDNSRVNAAMSLAMAFYDPDATKSYFDYLVAKYDGDLLNQMNDETLTEQVDQMREDFLAMEDLPFTAQRAKFHEYLDAIRGEDEVYAYFLEQLYDNEDLQSELEYVMEFKRFGDKEEKKMEQSYEGVVLTTAHSSKGLEWEYVFNSISKYDSEWLHSSGKKAKERLEETRRLLFVSMTRARDELTVTGQYIAFGTKETGYTNNQFLEEVHKLLGVTYDPVDHEAEKKKAEKEKKGRKAAPAA